MSAQAGQDLEIEPEAIVAPLNQRAPPVNFRSLAGSASLPA